MEPFSLGTKRFGGFDQSTRLWFDEPDPYGYAVTVRADAPPGGARVLPEYSGFTVLMGRADAGIAVGRRALVLDRQNASCHDRVGSGLFFARHHEEAVAAYDAVLALEHDNARTHGFRGLAYYVLGDLQSARARRANSNRTIG